MVHKIQLTNYTARLISENGDLKLGTQNSYGTEQLQLVLSSEWKDLTVTATFYAPGVRGGTRVLADADGMITVPPEATSGTWTIQPGRIVFAGNSDGIQRISYDLSYTVIGHSEIEGENSKVTPSILAQAIAQTGAARDEAVSAASKATLAQLAAESASEDIVAAVETTEAEFINAIASAKAGAIADIQATKEGSVKAVQIAQTIAESSIAENQNSALTTLKILQSDLEQAINHTKDESLNSLTTACNLQLERLEKLVPDVYTKSESDSHFAPISAAIRPTVKGNPAVCENSVAWALQGLKIYGKSVQNGIPTPENPIPIVSTGASGNIILNISDGTNESQTFLAITPNSLLGIPVTSGGNYTDESGQQWVANVKDYVNKTFTKYNNIYTVTGIEDVNSLIMKDGHTRFNIILPNADLPLAGSSVYLTQKSNLFKSTSKLLGGYDTENNTFQAVCSNNQLWILIRCDKLSSVDELKKFLQGNQLVVIYQINEPVTLPLSENELTSYRTLTTYDGMTTISTKELVSGIEIQYISDSTKYFHSIVDKINALINIQTKSEHFQNL